MTLKELIRESEEKMKKTCDATQREFNSVRTSRASPSLVEGIKIDYYGAPTVLKQLATITTPDPKTIVIQSWDPTAAAEIEKAILKSDLGIMPINDGKVIRISMPQLTKERKDELTKLAKKMSEDGKISIRSGRHGANEHIAKMFKDKKITEDERFNGAEEIQKLTDKYIKEIETLLAKKEKEVLEG